MERNHRRSAGRLAAVGVLGLGLLAASCSGPAATKVVDGAADVAGTGGAPAGTGGLPGSGGNASGSGGASSTGGAVGSGGTSGTASGGAASGGASASGGTAGALGGAGTAGTPAGGRAGTGAGGGVAASGGRAGAGGRMGTGGAGGAKPTVTPASGTTLVKVNPGARHQTFEGWGTSLAWWANHVGGWSAANRDALVDAVADPVKGLGYNIFRYNIGGGENPAHTHMGEFRDMPGFLASNGTWNWNADANQRAILQRIVERADPTLILEAFSNSPPYWMTKSGCASGSSDGSNNLKDDQYDAFADYLTEVVKHFRETSGITFRTLEPLNEPNANWWKSNGGQEGCHFSPSNQQTIIKAVGAKLAAKGLTGTTVGASDENSIDDAVTNLRGYDAATLGLMSQMNVHSYAGSRRAELRTLATSKSKKLWQSESGPLSVTLADDSEAAVFMAGRIISDLRDLQAEAWVDWQFGDPGRNWACVVLNDQKQTFTYLKRFYMHAGFSRYIRPGATFVDVNSAEMVAAVSPDGASLVIVARNGGTASKGYTFDLTALASVGADAKAVRTSRTENLVDVPALTIAGWSFVATLPVASITTFVIPMP